ncbi:MAG: ribosome assembly factor SBDS [Candidatus Aenigmarchaeota archaeon]|nr:ribosome assembly factor SBDS [Candidatus Aenigmarchaeota archaeon]
MVTVDEAIIARFETKGKKFEILVDAEIAYALKEGKQVSLSRMLAANHIFTDAKKGTKASDSDIEKEFETADVEKIAERIVQKGDIQITTEFRRKKTEERKRQIASMISKNAVNPQTKAPHPQERILAAMEQARFAAVPFRTAEQQVDDALKAIKSVLPISMEQATLLVEIPAKYSSKCYGMLKEYTIIQDKWLPDGSLSAKITLPAGLKDNFFRAINNATQGEVRIQELSKDVNI